jgi:ferredoxin
MRQFVLRVDPIACDGHGLCAELFPERIDLDEWGYPIIGHETIGRDLEKHARRAVAACPKLALRVETVTSNRPRDRAAR